MNWQLSTRRCRQPRRRSRKPNRNSRPSGTSSNVRSYSSRSDVLPWLTRCSSWRRRENIEGWYCGGCTPERCARRSTTECCRDDQVRTHTDIAVFLQWTDMLYALLNSETSGKAGMIDVYQTFLKVGKAKKTCQACNRHMDDRELAVFEKYVRWWCLRRSLRLGLTSFTVCSSKSKSERTPPKL